MLIPLLLLWEQVLQLSCLFFSTKICQSTMWWSLPFTVSDRVAGGISKVPNDGKFGLPLIEMKSSRKEKAAAGITWGEKKLWQDRNFCNYHHLLHHPSILILPWKALVIDYQNIFPFGYLDWKGVHYGQLSKGNAKRKLPESNWADHQDLISLFTSAK